MKFTPIALFAFLPLAACAGYDIVPVAPIAEDKWAAPGSSDEGYLIYEPEPYLQVVLTPADGGKLTATASVVYLPNRKRAYRVNTYTFLATADIKLTYRDGWMLTNADSSVDTSGIAKAVIEAAGGLKALTAADAPAGTVKLFRFEFGADGRVSKLTEVADVAIAMGR
jgi:hypothetical protein